MVDHIPGPPVRYEFDEHGGYDCMSAGYRVLDADGRTCVTVDTRDYRSARMMKSCTPLEEAEALARLIAAAPDLLQAGKYLAVKLADAYRIAKCDPAKCEAIISFVMAVDKVEGRS